MVAIKRLNIYLALSIVTVNVIMNMSGRFMLIHPLPSVFLSRLFLGLIITVLAEHVNRSYQAHLLKQC